MSIEVKVKNRAVTTKGELRRLRENGLVPASVTGKKIAPVSLAIEEKELLQLLREHSREIMEMNIPNEGRQTVMLKDVQRDKLNAGRLLHVDFQQISMKDPVKTTVRIELVGEAFGLKEGGILQQMINEIEVRALPGDLPTEIQVDVSGLAIGDKLVVEDIAVPNGVECLTDPASLVATVLQVRITTEEEQEEMASEAEEKGGLKENSGAKLSDRPNAEDAAEETAGV